MMHYWRLTPAAAPDDSRWLEFEIWDEVIVEAETASLARITARNLEREPDQAKAGNESQTFRSGFEDEKLYHVTRLEEKAAAAHAEKRSGHDVPEGILLARKGDQAE